MTADSGVSAPPGGAMLSAWSALTCCGSGVNQKLAVCMMQSATTSDRKIVKKCRSKFSYKHTARQLLHVIVLDYGVTTSIV